MSLKTLFIIAASLAAAGAQAQAQAPTSTPTPSLDRQARAWAASCAACHGTDGRGSLATPGTAIPPIGRDADATYRALVEFKTGQRPAATVMHQHTKGYTDDELRRIAQFYASLPAK